MCLGQNEDFTMRLLFLLFGFVSSVHFFVLVPNMSLTECVMLLALAIDLGFSGDVQIPAAISCYLPSHL